MRLELFKPGVGDGVYEAVAASDTKTLAPDTRYEFDERIPVKRGYVLGLEPDVDAEVAITVPSAGDDKIYQFGGDVPIGDTATATGPFPTYRVNVGATIEPDADRDGYGDRSQDGCPTQAATHGACSNRFSIGKLKRKRSKGTAILPVTVPGAGTLSLCGKGVVKQSPARTARTSADRPASSAGTVKLLTKAKGKAKRKLNRKGK